MQSPNKTQLKTLSSKIQREIVLSYLLGNSVASISRSQRLNDKIIRKVLIDNGIELRGKSLQAIWRPTAVSRNQKDPSPKDISKMTAKIRENWTVEEHYRRAGIDMPVTDIRVINEW